MHADDIDFQEIRRRPKPLPRIPYTFAVNSRRQSQHSLTSLDEMSPTCYNNNNNLRESLLSQDYSVPLKSRNSNSNNHPILQRRIIRLSDSDEKAQKLVRVESSAEPKPKSILKKERDGSGESSSMQNRSRNTSGHGSNEHYQLDHSNSNNSSAAKQSSSIYLTASPSYRTTVLQPLKVLTTPVKVKSFSSNSNHQTPVASSGKRDPRGLEQRRQRLLEDQRLDEMFTQMEEQKELQFHSNHDIIRMAEKVISNIDRQNAVNKRKPLYDYGESMPVVIAPVVNHSIQKTELVYEVNDDVLEKHINAKLDAIQGIEEIKYSKKYAIYRQASIEAAKRRSSKFSPLSRPHKHITHESYDVSPDSRMESDHSPQSLIRLQRMGTKALNPIRRRRSTIRDNSTNKVNNLLAKIFVGAPQELSVYHAKGSHSTSTRANEKK